MPASPEDRPLERRAGPGRRDAPGCSNRAARGAFLAPGAVAAVALLASIALTTTGGATSRAAYPASPPPAHTGGFGEPTCHACHFEAAPNEPGGTLGLAGLPTTYTPGESYTLTVELTRPGIGAAGFQLAARFATGPHSGAQAGELRPVDERSTFTSAGEPDIHYLHHAEAGTGLQLSDTARWTFEWIAPVDGGTPVDGGAMIAGGAPAGDGTVVFHFVANAADGDASPFGDLIYTGMLELPRGVPGPARR